MYTMAPEKFSFKKRLKSFSHAFRGLKILFRDTHNARIHLVAALVVIFFAAFFKLTIAEWLILIVMIALVIAAELFNSSIEYLCDAVTKDFHPMIKNAKDMAAGAVLIISIGAAIGGILIFVPYILKYFQS